MPLAQFAFLSNAFLGICAIQLLCASLIAASAALQTARDARTEQYQLLRLTNIADIGVVKSYIVAALYRWWMLLIVGIGLLPALLLCQVEMHRLALVRDGLQSPCVGPLIACLGHYRGVAAQANAAALTQRPGWVLIFAGVAIGLLGINFLAAAVGVGSAFRSRDVMPPAVSALVAWLALIGLAGVTINMLRSISSIPMWEGSDTVQLWLFSLVFAVLPYVAARSAANLTARWMR
jgi:hypothetical protein